MDVSVCVEGVLVAGFPGLKKLTLSLQEKIMQLGSLAWLAGSRHDIFPNPAQRLQAFASILSFTVTSSARPK